MYTNIAKNPLRTFLGLNREKNKNIKASPKKRSSYKKKKCKLYCIRKRSKVRLDLIYTPSSHVLNLETLAISLFEEIISTAIGTSKCFQSISEFWRS